ncbi:DUF3489 domain-containing protein [Aestuariicoccus sp. MJ-SS9]|uniref:DUF3489 domain-containing protein n=1 Tax=Aestuariicoccus sp. MJ-SS9 TaxID=3079855 RepID=UPI0029117ABE|nr:DUF3489 domain-containing protein [Aestuariicoccus sp. MJ-SS9]MDU8912865.1 DUF3489 domain-containing protein [Aestuariicoccus sp. MJ-SS9]
MTKLTKLQTALIEQATKRADGALLPVSEMACVTDAALTRAMDGLVQKGFATRIEMPDADDREGPAFFLTQIGRNVAANEGRDVTCGKKIPSADEPKRPSGKLGAVLKAIGRKRGATLAELTEATGWQPHTTRSALTRLRQRGFRAELTEEGGRKAYRLQG